MDNLEVYNRQQDIVGAPEVVHIVGCGGVGTWAAIMFALAGSSTIHLYDDDVIEESNLNRLPYFPALVGQDKVKTLTVLLTELRPGLNVVRHGKFEPLLHKIDQYATVIGAVDTIRDRQVIHKACNEAEGYYIDVGAEQHHCTISRSPAEWPIAEDRPGYFTPIWVAPVVVAAGLAVAAACNGLGATLNVDLRQMRIVSIEEPS